MYELGGRQYLLVTASTEKAPTVAGGALSAAPPAGASTVAPSGPTGLVAYALPSQMAPAR